MIPVILSGGSGTRLWPVSRASYPKQFCEFYDQSFLKNSIERLQPFGAPHVVTVGTMEALTARTLKEMGLPKENAIYEPLGKNTAPAVALMCHVLQQQGKGEEIVGMFPADHLITDARAFEIVLRLGEQVAQQNEVVTLGIEPRYAATGYGYIEVKDDVVTTVDNPRGGMFTARMVKGFHEKPGQSRADEFRSSGRHYWNAGMFLFRVNVMVGHFKKHLPNLWTEIEKIKPDFRTAKYIYANLESESLDYGIMEKLEKQVCIPCEIGWSDVGSWDEIARLADEVPSLKSDVNAKVFNQDAYSNYVFSAKNKVIGLVGVNNLIVVDTPDALLISNKGQSEKVKDLVGKIKEVGHPEATDHPFETRPWGGFETLADNKDFKTKRITVDPGAQLSYQSHNKRAEHWIVISGEAEVVLNDEVIPRGPGEHIYIPVNAKHRVRNNGTAPLVFVEVQTGSYFGEDDIIRYEDDYNRA